MLVSGYWHNIFSLESTDLTDTSTGSRSSIQIRAGYCMAKTFSYGKGKVIPLHAMEAHGVTGGTAPIF
jgi:hypothetical protein